MQAIADTQQRILDSARELFYSRSYADVGVAAICEHAGVKKGSFYHYFPSKRELTLAVVDNYYADLKKHLIDKAFADDLPPLARLDRLAVSVRGEECLDRTRLCPDRRARRPPPADGQLGARATAQRPGRDAGPARDLLTDAYSR